MAMSKCPKCQTPGAYIGFSSIECRNPTCLHYSQKLAALCPCCGEAGHRPEYEKANAAADATLYDPNVATSGAGSSGTASGADDDEADDGSNPSEPGA